MVGSRIKTLLQNSVLTLASILIVLALCEYGLRASTVFSPGGALSTIWFPEEPIADRHVTAVPIPQGVDWTWFRQQPPQIARHQQEVSPTAAELYEKYNRRGLYAAQSYYVWNKVFVDSHVCGKKDHVFGHYGDLASHLKVFLPQDGQPYPRYRFPPDTITPGGLRTNRYGFRGPELALHKDPKTIRIAFLGASTTIAPHQFPFSYPDHFAYWLNLWLQANNYPLQAEIINAGREGSGSTDIAAIFEQEVLPLAPDYVIYYEGANHISFGSELVDASGPVPTYPAQELLPKELVRTFSIAKLIEDFNRARVIPILTEWRRPGSKLIFPDGINEFEPDIDRTDLPINLSIILGNLRHIVNLSEKSGIRFLVSSFVWLDGGEPDIVRDNPRHAEILSQVNRVFWPFLPHDIRRLVDFQNRVFQRFAAAYNLGFMDIAGVFPRDPDLFTDGIHFTPEGVRMQGWIALAQFLPSLIRDLERGFTPNAQLPDAGSAMFVSTKGEPFEAKCTPSPTELAAARTMPISAMNLAYERSSLSPNDVGLVARSAPVPWAYIARLPLHIDCGVTDDQGWISVDVHVIRGTIGIGVLNQMGDDFIVRSFLTSSKDFQTIFLPLPSFKDAEDLIVQNGDENRASEGIFRKVQIIKAGGEMSECQVGGVTVSSMGRTASAI